jgi:hypothetical protein
LRAAFRSLLADTIVLQELIAAFLKFDTQGLVVVVAVSGGWPHTHG